jgi:putative membrane protein insertion efficiency factor
VFSADVDPASGPGVRLALAMLRAYKVVISPLFAGSCRFLPSCSDYARDAIVQHGALKGSWLALGRLARCHPFAAAGYDPVPERRAAPNRHCCQTSTTQASPGLKA